MNKNKCRHGWDGDCINPMTAGKHVCMLNVGHGGTHYCGCGEETKQ